MQWTDWSADQSIVDTQLAVNEILLQTRIAEHKRSKPRQQITVDVVFLFMLNWNQITVKRRFLETLCDLPPLTPANRGQDNWPHLTTISLTLHSMSLLVVKATLTTGVCATKLLTLTTSLPLLSTTTASNRTITMIIEHFIAISRSASYDWRIIIEQEMPQEDVVQFLKEIRHL